MAHAYAINSGKPRIVRRGGKWIVYTSPGASARKAQLVAKTF